MALTTVQIGLRGQAYAKKQAVWGTFEPLAASNAFRHKSLTFPGSDNKNKRTIIEKQTSPFTKVAQRTAQRTIAGFNLQAILRPSGTINTLCEADPFLECGFGAKTNTVLATTVNAGTGTVGGATLASGTGAAVGLPLLITCPDGKKRVRFLATVAGAVVTWAPNLPAGQQPADGAAAKLGTRYTFTSQNLLFLTITHYLKNLDASAGLARQLDSAVVEKLAIMFDANDEPILTISGPGRLLDTAGAQAQPGGFTQVGAATPPSGLTGEFLIGNTAAKIMKLGVEITNALKIRNESYGFSAGEESFRVGRPEITIGLDMRAESESLIYDAAEAGTNVGMFLQTGFTEGNIIAIRTPNTEFKEPDTDDSDEEVNFPFKGMALETTEGALDALALGLC